MKHPLNPTIWILCPNINPYAIISNMYVKTQCVPRVSNKSDPSITKRKQSQSKPSHDTTYEYIPLCCQFSGIGLGNSGPLYTSWIGVRHSSLELYCLSRDGSEKLPRTDIGGEIKLREDTQYGLCHSSGGCANGDWCGDGVIGYRRACCWEGIEKCGGVWVLDDKMVVGMTGASGLSFRLFAPSHLKRRPWM